MFKKKIIFWTSVVDVQAVSQTFVNMLFSFRLMKYEKIFPERQNGGFEKLLRHSTSAFRTSAPSLGASEICVGSQAGDRRDSYWNLEKKTQFRLVLV